MAIPAPGSAEELAAYQRLQARLPDLFRRVFADPLEPRTVVIVPGLTMDQDVLAKVLGGLHYEERQLAMLMLLRLPNTRVVFVSSTPIERPIVDYYLGLLPGITRDEARQRLVLLSASDASAATLTQKILERPRLLERIRDAMGDPALAHLSCFNVTALERTLAVRLGIPLYGCDPSLQYLGGKSGSRAAFREAGVLLPDGREDLRSVEDVVEALADLKSRNPSLPRAALKLNDGFSGEGNAVFSYAGCTAGDERRWIDSARAAQSCVRGARHALGTLRRQDRGVGRHRRGVDRGRWSEIAVRATAHHAARRPRDHLDARPDPRRALGPGLPGVHVSGRSGLRAARSRPLRSGSAKC